MNTILKPIICMLLLGLTGCEKETDLKSHLDSVAVDKYYSEEIIPSDYQMIYGKWKLYAVSGGFSGTGHEPDYDYLEIKNIGIYGLIRNNQLFEYGKIELDTFDTNTKDLLQIRLVPDLVRQEPYIYPPEKYIDLNGIDSLSMLSPCCDMFNYHYKRVK